MKVIKCSASVLACSLLLPQSSIGAPTVGATDVLGPWVGQQMPKHPDNVSPDMDFGGTDLGFTYKHGNELKILFGDTADSWGLTIGASRWWLYDDAYGAIDLNTYPNPSLFNSSNLPLVKLAQKSNSGELIGLDPGKPMELFKTPEGGFSSGSREFGVFIMGKPLACQYNSQCSSVNPALSCDTGLGWWETAPWEDTGVTKGCLDTQSGCNDNTIPWTANTGFCRDTGSSSYANTTAGRIGAWAFKMRFGVRNQTNAWEYDNPVEWTTNRFYNLALATVQSFVPANGSSGQNYSVATSSGTNRRVFIWGRPGFVGVNSAGRPANLYFSYIDMPTGTTVSSTRHYYKGTNSSGIPEFSTDESEAAELDLDADVVGVQPNEPHDVVGQMSVVWVSHINKWVMFYGGGMSERPKPSTPGQTQCGIVELFTGVECSQVVQGNRAIRMRTADNPWGPWTQPTNVLVGGSPHVSPLEGQFAPGGILRHPDCVGSNCAPHSYVGDLDEDEEYGWLYSPVIHAPWIKPVGGPGTGVDLIWSVSTWDPYQVTLLRTRINP